MFSTKELQQIRDFLQGIIIMSNGFPEPELVALESRVQEELDAAIVLWSKRA